MYFPMYTKHLATKTFFGMNKALSSFLSNQQKLFVSHSTTDLVA